MKLVKTVLVAFLLLLPVGLVRAQSVGGFYVRFDTGISSATNPDLHIPTPLPADLGKSSLFSVGGGYRFMKNVRADLTLTYRGGFKQTSGFVNQPQGTGDFLSYSGLATVYYDRRYARHWTPYAGFGVGFAQNKLGPVFVTNVDKTPLATISSGTDTGFAWQIALGTGFDLSDQFILDFGYHFFHLNNYESGGSIAYASSGAVQGRNTGHLSCNEFQIGLRWVL